MAGEWACRLGALPPMCMTHHGPDPTGIDRIQGCGGIDRASGELPSDHQLDTDKGIGHRGKFRKPAPRARASQRCEIQVALRRRAAPFTPSAHAVNPTVATDEERPLRFEQRTGSENLEKNNKPDRPSQAIPKRDNRDGRSEFGIPRNRIPTLGARPTPPATASAQGGTGGGADRSAGRIPRPGSTTSRTTSKDRNWPTGCRPSPSSTSRSFRRSSHHAATATAD